MEKTAPEFHEIPRFVSALLRKATSIGITEEELSRQLGVSHSYFSRWKRGLRWTPDPRLKENKEFYLRVARFLDKGLGEILAEVLFLDKEEEAELERFVFESIDLAKKSIQLPEYAADTEHKLRTLLLNLAGREAFADVLLESFRTYVTRVLHQDWIEDPLALVSRPAMATPEITN